MDSKRMNRLKGPGGLLVALLVGSVAVAGLVQGTPPASSPGQPFEEILDAIEDLSAAQGQIAADFGEQVTRIEQKVDNIADQLDDVNDKLDEIEAKLDVLHVEA